MVRVLIASNGPLFARSLSRMIGRQQYDIVCTSRGSEARSLLSGGQVDLCFLQDSLPDQNGLDICEEVSRTHDDKPVPIIIFSSNDAVKSTALSKGAAGFLKVPCRADEVSDIAARWSRSIRDAESGSRADRTSSGARDVSKPKDEEAAADAMAAGDSAAAGEIENSPLILLVDDSRFIHKSVGVFLRENGYQVLDVYNGVEGVKLAKERSPNLIISDIDMPEMDGYDMCKVIKEDEVTRHIPILILSSREEGIDVDRGFDAGANDFLTKPVSENELLSRLDLMLSTTSGAARAREKILVVEDSALQRNVIGQGLLQQGFQVISAVNGQEGLELAIEYAPDLIVTDSEMPVMNGRDMTRALKKLEELKDTPVIMLTAADTPEARAKGEHAGVSVYLAKPFVPDKIVVIVEKLIAERRLLREKQAMQRYLSEAAVAAAVDAAESTGDVREIMRAEEKFATIFFSDIVGFTPMTEQMEAHELIKLLNDYFDAVAPIFQASGGTIDKFIGDAIMAVFIGEDEESHGRSAYNAVLTGLKMLQTLEAFNEGRPHAISVRVGINSGPVSMGDIGSRHHRRDYTVIGDHVNIAARLESVADHNSVLISESTYQLIDGLVSVQPVGPIEVKGKSKPISVYKVDAVLEPETMAPGRVPGEELLG